MRSFQSLQEQHTNSIQLDKNAVISKAIESLEETLPLLISYRVHLRKMKGIYNKIDERNESARMIQEINYLCAHNLIYFLTVTHQFNLLRELFQNNDKMAELIRLINEIEQEKEHVKAQNYLLAYESVQKTLHQEQHNPSVQSAPSEQNGVNELLLYHHYDALYKNMTHKHHHSLIEIYEMAYEGRIARMHDVRQAVLDNPSVSYADKKMIVDMKREYMAEVAQIKNMSTTHPDGSPNFKAAEEKLRLMRDVDEKFSKRFDQYLQSLINAPNVDPNLKSVLQETLHEERKATQHTQEQVIEQEQNHHEKVKDILAHREINHKATNEYVQNFINIMGNVLNKQIPIEDRAEYIASTNELNKLNNELINADTPERQKELLRQCAVEMDKLQRIAEPRMSENLKQQLNENLDKVHQLLDVPHLSMANEASQVSMPDLNVVSADEQPGLPNDSLPTEHTEEGNVHSISCLNSESSSRNEAPSASVQKSSMSSNYSNIEKQRTMKELLQENRFSSNVVAKFIEACNNLKSEVDGLMEFEEFSIEDLKNRDQLCSLCEKLDQEPGGNAVDERLVSEIMIAAEKLSANHEALDECKCNLEATAEKLSPSVEPREAQSFRY